MTITFKDGTIYENITVHSKGNQIVQGANRAVYELIFPASVGFTAVRTLSKNTSELSEFTLQSDDSNSVHSGFTIAVALSENLQSGEISLTLAQKTEQEITTELQEETLISILTDILPNI